MQIHRIMPGKKGGQYTLDNCRLICVTCHKYVEGRDEREYEVIRKRVRESQVVQQ